VEVSCGASVSVVGDEAGTVVLDHPGRCAPYFPGFFPL
jgi:hypothetical protein